MAQTLHKVSMLAARLLPFGFAREGRVLVAAQHPDALEVWICEETRPQALAEVGRVHGALRTQLLPLPDWQAALTEAYANSESGAAQVVAWATAALRQP